MRRDHARREGRPSPVDLTAGSPRHWLGIGPFGAEPAAALGTGFAPELASVHAGAPPHL